MKTPLNKRLYIILTLPLYLILKYVSMSNQPIMVEVLLGFTLSFLWISMGFNIMHDASHYALFKSPKFNNYASRIWNAFSTWNHNLWFYHHVLYHHSFTNTIKDADIYHIMPLFRKHSSQKQGWLPPFLYPLVAFTIPGAFFGQALMYAILGSFFGVVFVSDLKIPRNNYSRLDCCLMLSRVLLFYQMGFWSAISYMIGCSIFYKMNVIGDHDTYGVSVENHYEGNDWLKLQIPNSRNFKTDCPIYTFVFGGINYQIEHHLFPSMSNSYYSQIAPTVKEFCKEHGIPYVEHHSLLEVFQQYYKTLKYFNSKKNL